jgi:hypothetical protein
MVESDNDPISQGEKTLLHEFLQCLIPGQWPDDTPDNIRNGITIGPPPESTLQRRRTPESAEEHKARLKARAKRLKTSKADRKADREGASASPPTKSQRKNPPDAGEDEGEGDETGGQEGSADC